MGRTAERATPGGDERRGKGVACGLRAQLCSFPAQRRPTPQTPAAANAADDLIPRSTIEKPGNAAAGEEGMLGFEGRSPPPSTCLLNARGAVSLLPALGPNPGRPRSVVSSFRFGPFHRLAARGVPLCVPPGLVNRDAVMTTAFSSRVARPRRRVKIAAGVNK